MFHITVPLVSFLKSSFFLVFFLLKGISPQARNVG